MSGTTRIRSTRSTSSRMPLQRLRRRAGSERRAYHPDAGEGAHLATLSVYGGVVATLAVAVRLRQTVLPSVSAWDTACVALATYKGARLLSKDKVTAPLRVPFTRRDGEGEANEVMDAPRGAGGRRAVGELMACPFCLGQWVATGFATGLIFVPGATRLVASTLAAVAAADFLHHVNCAAQQLPGALEALGRRNCEPGADTGPRGG